VRIAVSRKPLADAMLPSHSIWSSLDFVTHPDDIIHAATECSDRWDE
jgi:hypothetical protein